MAIRYYVESNDYSYINRYEALGLNREQVEKLAYITACYQAAGSHVTLDDLVNLVVSPLVTADLELKLPWYVRLELWVRDILGRIAGRIHAE